MSNTSRPRRFDAQAIAERVRAAKGLASAKLLSFARPGAVYRALNDRIIFPESELRNDPEADYDTRRVIVMSALNLATGDSPVTILIVPCSASHTGAVSPWDLELPPPQREPAFDAPRVVAYVSLIQPMLKCHLKDFMGHVSPATKLELQKRLPYLFGLPITTVTAGFAEVDDRVNQPVRAGET